MFLSNHHTNEFVVDFQLIYDTDSHLQLDFYADGLCKEAEVLKYPSCFEKRGYGLVVAPFEDYEAYDHHFHTIMNNREKTETILSNMTNTIRVVQRLCRVVEREQRENKWDTASYQALYEATVHMMAYKRISDHFESHMETCVHNVRVPSYLLYLMKGLSRISPVSSDQEIQKFIDRYGFLQGFTIHPTELESIEGVKAYLLKNGYFNQPHHSGRYQKPQTTEEKTYKSVVWYEEMRHLYQMRVVRNFRRLFQHQGLDIYETTMDTLKNGGEKYVISYT